MAIYNFAKAADRARCRAARQAEIAAIDAGTWPRDIDDAMRWGATKCFPSVAARAAFAREMCASEVAYVDGVDARIRAGDPSVSDWEVSHGS